uniref:Uncharacterized protein n=1 Tax=Romanomermis culicivorax TaxID=13658 RepID=A0A915HGI0_ROMCU
MLGKKNNDNEEELDFKRRYLVVAVIPHLCKFGELDKATIPPEKE